MNEPIAVIIALVMIMKGSKDLLSSILKTTQMGQEGIRCVMGANVRHTLRKELESQLREYDSIEREAHAIAASRGWVLEELSPSAKRMAKMMTRSKLATGNIDSKAAAMMINGNTKGMIKSLKNIHQFRGFDHQISVLSQKLLDCETANIRQMQGFL